MQEHVSLRFYVFLIVFLWLLFFCWFVSSYSGLFGFVLLFFRACLCSSERDKGYGVGWERNWGRAERSWERESCSQNILYFKKIDFQKKKKKLGMVAHICNSSTGETEDPGESVLIGKL